MEYLEVEVSEDVKKLELIHSIFVGWNPEEQERELEGQERQKEREHEWMKLEFEKVKLALDRQRQEQRETFDISQSLSLVPSFNPEKVE